MKYKNYSCFYSLLFLVLLMLDRASKVWALVTLQDWPIEVNSYFNLSFMLNRGVSWGLLFFEGDRGFYLITSLVIGITLFFCFYTIQGLRRGESMWWEICVLAGAISNIVDRFLYGGVIDFIQLHYGAWYWPTFNIADMCVVFGIFGVLYKQLGESCDRKDTRV